MYLCLAGLAQFLLHHNLTDLSHRDLPVLIHIDIFKDVLQVLLILYLGGFKAGSHEFIVVYLAVAVRIDFIEDFFEGCAVFAVVLFLEHPE